MCKDVYVFAEQRDGNLQKVGIELIGEARKLADEIGVDYETFVQAQFYALEFCNGIPKIEDLSNDKARQRVINYMAKFNIVSRPKSEHVDLDAFKR